MCTLSPKCVIIRNCLSVVQAVTHLAELDHCDLVIASDANSVYISEILDHHGLMHCFKEVCPFAFIQDELPRTLTGNRFSSCCMPSACCKFSP
jgi:phosphoglycolate phosphatase-like HAD superfamily hydrolase